VPQASTYIDLSIPGVPLPILTYEVPESLGRAPIAGMRAVVPLGKRIVTGFITEVHQRTATANIRAVLELPDSEAIMSEQIIRLCRWISHYYHAPLGETLKATLPQGMDIEGERIIAMQTADIEQIESAIGRSKIKRAILDQLSTGEVISEDKLRKTVHASSISAQLRDLSADGIISIETVMKAPTAKVKYRKAIRLQAGWQREAQIRELIELIEKRAPKQVNIIALLWSAFQKGVVSLPMQEAIESARTGSSAVHALADKEIIEIFEEEVTREVSITYEEVDKEITLTDEQQSVFATLSAQIDAGEFAANLLYGVTGSGKTQVYIEAIAHALATGMNALVLVPEVSLTPQLVYRFRKAFGDEVTVMHSRLSIGERFDAWRLTREGKYRVVVGVRSAIFAPLDNLGIIIVDEEHEPSYKQSDQQPRFHARDVAVMRGWTESAVVVLGSATPSAESWHNAQQGKYQLIEMTKRIAGATMPEITIVDMIEARKMSAAKGSFSDDLLARLRSRREQSEGSIVFQNRRGYAMHIECGDCDYVPHCINCSITLTYHKDKQLLQCHYCGYTSRLPLNCPECGSKELHQQGSGTQRLEEELQELIPETRILRMDFDSTRRKGSHDMMLTSFAEDGADVLLGTQMVAKGLDFDRVTLVGVVSAEQSLLMPDFRAEERTFQLLTQVSGRSGRGAKKGEVVLQSTQTAHQVFTHILEDDYRGFITIELQRRKALFYPPFARVVLITFLDDNDGKAAAASRVFANLIEHKADFFKMYPPQAALIKRINRKYRYQVFCRVDKQKDPDGLRFESVLKAAETEFHKRRESRGVIVVIDIDPYNLM
jgi:primosomal protein N' (replication factor Y) (superfamily II helicase)